MATLAEFYNSCPSRGTVHSYSWAITKLERHLGLEPGQIEPWLNAASQQELDDALTGYYLKEVKALKPMSRMLVVAATRQLLRWFKKDPEILKQLTGRKPGYHPLTMDALPPEDLLGRMFKLWNATFQAYFACLGSSGARGSELLNVPKVDLQLDQEPARIIIRKAKGGMPRFVFINEQAKGLLLQHIKGNPGTSQIFGFTIYDVDHSWAWALRRLKINARDPITSRRIYHPHVLRKRFRTIMGPRLNRDHLEALLGHSGYLDGAYRRYLPEDLAPHYLEHQEALNIATATAN